MKSWKDIRADSAAFAKRWRSGYDEKSQAQSFLKEFFAVFGIDALQNATFESRIKLRDESQGFIDCLWKGVLLVEMKSAGKDLARAFEQAKAYAAALPPADIPQVILVCDFRSFHLYDLRNDSHLTTFQLAQLPKFVRCFGFLVGDESLEHTEQDPVNRLAAENMGRIHDALSAAGYTGKPLEIYLVRLLFCLFAENTEIFEDDQFSTFIRRQTRPDGSDLGAALAEIFQTLNTPPEKRLSSLRESVAAFPYVNGGLFAETIPLCSFTEELRTVLLGCGALDWSAISPAIFGAMFQSVMDPEQRRALGAHYTSEANILKLIRPLFLDSLRAEFASFRALRGPARTRALKTFHDRLASLVFLDPACGCGNFLVVTYRELRLLELDLLEALYEGDHTQLVLNIADHLKIDVNQFHGFEIEPFPAQIAAAALWLTDHLCNLQVAARFGRYYTRIPIRNTPRIHCLDALAADWSALVSKQQLTHILGNPPFNGARLMGDAQKKELLNVFGGAVGAGNLDFVTGWFKKASDFIQGTAIRCAFVATNSITQGEQPAILWPHLNIELTFARRTFKWRNEAKHNAAVHCVVLGFATPAAARAQPKILFDGDDALPAANINPYLIDAPTVLIQSRSTPICSVPEIGIGNKPIDGGNYLFTEDEKAAFLLLEPAAEKWFRPWLGSDEFLNGYRRHCLWLGDCPPEELRRLPHCLARVEAVRAVRLASKSPGTRKIAETPTRFHVENIPQNKYILIPKVSSERRTYIPIGFIEAETLASDLVFILPDATLYHFSILTSSAHNAWMRAVAGRLKSDYRYSASIVYNTFIWPETDEPQRAAIAGAGQRILEVRAAYPGATLADLYSPLAMPADLLNAHHALDRLVLKAYGLPSDTPERTLVARLFELYAALGKKLK